MFKEFYLGKDKRRSPLWKRLLALAGIAALAAADQFIKRWAAQALAPVGSKPLVPGVLGLQYTQNTGISFSVFGDSVIVMRLVAALTAAVILAGFVLLLSGRAGAGSPMGSLTLILAGGLGNLIDRALQGYVVDYFEFLFVRFAVFNAADVFIFCGVTWLAVWILVQETSRAQTAVMP